ncbi:MULTISPECIES: hypothetical protein [Bacillaceae]|uniref:Lipoprotein n=1 Tax=Evansella alkalicola TaxID=745819 RepID=A0ABS6JSX3_9BACI|nr:MULTISPECIES: hypothetical protein [Bacillaceae]MBU9721670.1 hypothetical protein [Bacillus alkalicola]
MNKSRRRLVYGVVLGIVAVTSFIVIVGCQSSSKEEKNMVHSPGGQYPFYEEVEQLYTNADIVVEGKVQSSEAKEVVTSTELNDSEITTVSQFEVSTVYKGEVSVGEMLEVKQSGGETEDTIFVVEGEQYLASGKSYVLFLNSYGYLIHPEKGQYVVGEDNELESVEGNDFVLTREDLEY